IVGPQGATGAQGPAGATAAIEDGTITNAKIASNAAIAYSKLALTNSIKNGDLVAGAVSTSKVLDGTVTSAKIFDGTIVNADISPAAAIALSKLNATGTPSASTYLRGDGAWATPTATVADGSITNAKVADGASIQYNKLNLNNSIQNGDIQASAITTSKVANGTVTTSKMADGAITPLKINMTNNVPANSVLMTASASTTSSNSADDVGTAWSPITVSKITTTSGTPSSSTYLRGDGTWSTPSSSGGSSGLLVTTSTSLTITDFTKTYFIFNFNGSMASGISATFPSASSYPEGTMLTLAVVGQNGGTVAWSLTAANGNLFFSSQSTANNSASISISGVNGIKFVSDGVSKWYRIFP
ncbi:MAG: hypothetical protein ACO1N4_08130, partial [Pedobacter sp.]